MGRSAVVVGGGIGGLAAALGLRLVGWDVTVVEQAPALADVGAGISLAANGIHALDALGVGDAVRAAGRGQYTGGTRTPGGHWLARMDGAAVERVVGTPIVGIPRAALHRALRSALPPESLVIGTEATGLDLSDPTRPRVTCEGAPRDADLVIAADGVDSRLRTALFPHHPGPAYSGSTVLRAITEHPVELRTDFELSWGRGVEFGHIAFADGRAEWHAVVKTAAGVRHSDPLGAVRRRFGDWHDPVPALLAATRPADVLHHDVHELAVPLPSYTAGRVALLGDAAHAMTPNLGQGACQALEDAVVLAAALAAESTPEAALARYDAERRPRSQAVARAARQAGRMGHQLTNPLAVAVRNTAVRLTPFRLARHGVLRHHAWTPPRLTPAAW
ncbi:2-polyprenyl-6-methoxyphenol hydroxylase [Streptomyces sp. cf386]|uniref:FAD-dependent monooxygenase n=1 Tax=Streptomyces sp. cf386 TaxID=1761904 RepID=UPI00088C9891|nr:FAD-dependent monooxygenase [Streptomyces sp. cf386]SDM80733.1 2-polyprenyl-6-methoxyphenol hydroxylase [Streptomyces sp. cf386]